jgi:septum formation protein
LNYKFTPMGLLTRPVILASASPYRAQILRDAGIDFAVQPANIDEDLHPLDKPRPYCRSLAARKAMAVAPGVPREAVVVAADTICAIGSDIIGKPRDASDAQTMIERACKAGLQRVITGVCVVDAGDLKTFSFTATSLVEMRDASREEIAAYVATGDPMGKCGALSIESSGTLVKAWRGSYANSMGLPMERLLPILLRLDV